ncbi:MAG: hypothetical protein LBS85_00290, partial [Clostridiales Family XIII bacterium]|nr:hypothetical protein [Clostridiales Family XIII bacterium]
MAVTTEERIVTAAEAHSGSYADGTDFDELMDRTLKGGVAVKEFFGGKAYFRKGIFEKPEAMGATGYIPAGASAYKVDEGMFSYNKDSDQWFCGMGNSTMSKRTQKNGKMKRFHGMAGARGYGLESVRRQVKLTAIAVNLKRIARLAA